MKKCPFCAEEIQEEAVKCKHCGSDLTTSQIAVAPPATPKQKTSFAAKGCLVLILLFTIFLIVTHFCGPSSETISADTQKPRQTKKTENWKYTDSPDKMGRGSIKEASTISVNTISFDFPYAGAQDGTLELRTHPQYGKDVILRIERGQFLTGIDGCKVLVRFDDGKPQSFWANGPADHSTTTIFISDYSRFLTSIKRAKKVMIEAPFYQEGNQIFEFNVEGLQWETASSGKKK